MKLYHRKCIPCIVLSFYRLKIFAMAKAATMSESQDLLANVRWFPMEIFGLSSIHSINSTRNEWDDIEGP